MSVATTGASWVQRCARVLGVVLALPLFAATAAQPTSLTSIAFAPGGPDANGYVSAGTAVDYAVRHCGAGTIYLVAGIRRNTMQMDSRYWYKGKLRDVPPTMLMIQAEHMWVTGQAHHGAHITRFSGRIPISDKASCWFDGIGLPETPKGMKGDDFAKTFGIFFDRSTTVLRNPEFEKYLDQLDEAERKAEAERKKQEQERLAAERRKKEEEERLATERKKQEEDRLAAERKKQQDQERQGAAGGRGAGPAGHAGSGSGAASDDWGGGGSGSAGGSQQAEAPELPCGEPQFVKSGNRYFRKDCRGQVQEVNMDDYYRDQTRRAQAQKQAEHQQREQSAGAALQRLQEQQRMQAEHNARLEAELDTRLAGLQSAFAAGARVEEASANIRDLSRLEASYDSLEDLDQDFENRLSQLDGAFETMRAANADRVDAAVNTFYSDDQRAYGELTGMVAKMASEHSIQQQQNEARAAMRQQRAQLEAEILAARRAKKLALRRELLATFPDAPVPLSSQKVHADVLYFFSYAYNPASMEQDQPALTVTNVFPVARRSDGGWPFKRQLSAELGKLLSGATAWAGYYTSATDAQSQREQFLQYAAKGGFVVKEVEFKGRPATSGIVAQRRSAWDDEATHTGGNATSPDDWGMAEAAPAVSGAETDGGRGDW